MNSTFNQDTNISDLPSEIMIDILLKVEAEDPLPFRRVCKWWESLVVHPHFRRPHTTRSMTKIFALLVDAANYYYDFKVQYQIDNHHGGDENGADNGEILRVMKAFEETDNIWRTVDERVAEERAKNEGDLEASILNHIIVGVVHMKDNFNVIRDFMQSVEDRIRCHLKYLEIYVA